MNLIYYLILELIYKIKKNKNSQINLKIISVKLKNFYMTLINLKTNTLIIIKIFIN